MKSKRGASYRLLKLIGDERWRMSLSVPLLFEYEDVLKRQSLGLQVSVGEVDDVLDFICATADLREIFYLWRPTLPDPKDDFVLEVGVESECDFIVTFNVKDFKPAAQFGIGVITPSEFLRKLGEIP